MAKKRLYNLSIRIFTALLLLFISSGIYVAIVNKDSHNMTTRQKVMKAMYPMLMWVSKKSTGNKNKSIEHTNPFISFYSLTGTTINGSPFHFSQLKGRKILLVNTASDCGYTNQYAELEKLFQKYKTELAVIGFPANDFKEQEKGTNEDIAQFCKKNYGVSFMLMKKSVVIKGPMQNEVFKWLTDSSQNGWNNQQPQWNFTKFLINENGVLVNYFGPAVSPLDKQIVNLIEEK